jgi:hypothetical protein
MNYTKSVLLCALLISLSTTACSGLGDSGGVIPPPVTGDATLSVTLQAKPLIPPPGTNILSYSLTVGGLTLTPATGNPINIPGSLTFDMMRLQSDSGFLGTVTAPAGTYTSLTVSLTDAVVTFCTDTTGVPGCNTASVASVTGGASSPIITLPNGGLVLTSNQQTGISVDFNIGGTLSLTGQTVSKVDLSAAANLTAIPLGTTHPSDLAATQLDYLEDIVGSVAVNGNNVTITTANHGTITAIADSNTFFSPNCNLSGVGDGTNTIKCVQANQVASIDAILNADGTMKLIAFDPISAVTTTNNDFIEGVVAFAPTNPNQFTLIASDAALTTSGTVLPKPFPIGTTVNVTLVTNKPTPFAVDTNGLNVALSDVANFNTGTGSATSLIPGQMVAIRVASFTNNSGVFAVMTDALELRSSRVAGTAAQNGTNTGFLYSGTSLPPYLGINLPVPLVEFTIGTPPTQNSTHFDGVTSSTGVVNGTTYSTRALYFGQNASFPFVAGKVRQNQ